MTPQNKSSKANEGPAAPLQGVSPVQWLATKLAELRAPRRQMAQLKLPKRAKLHVPKATWFPSFWAARLAVRAAIPIEDFLQHRLSRQVATLPVSPSSLPVEIAIDEGGAITLNPRPPAASRRAPWLQSFLRAEGSSALAPEIQLAQADVARLAARIDVQRKRVEEVAKDMEESTRGAEVADPDDEAQAKQMGRPSVPAPLGWGLFAFAMALLLAETWQLAMPCLEAAGIHTLDLPAELRRNPVGVVMGGVFALGAAASLFLLAHVALRRGIEAFSAQAEDRQRFWGGCAAVGAAGLAVAMAWSIAGLRPGAGREVDARYAQATLFLVALAIPITTAWLLRIGRAMNAARAQAHALATAWDQAHYRTLAEIGRRAAALGEEERRLGRLESDRAATVRRLRALQARSVAAERLASDAADDEEQELARIAQAIAAGLELDRYEYLRQAMGSVLDLSHRRPQDARPRQAPSASPPVHAEESLGLAS